MSSKALSLPQKVIGLNRLSTSLSRFEECDWAVTSSPSLSFGTSSLKRGIGYGAGYTNLVLQQGGGPKHNLHIGFVEGTAGFSAPLGSAFTFTKKLSKLKKLLKTGTLSGATKQFPTKTILMGKSKDYKSLKISDFQGHCVILRATSAQFVSGSYFLVFFNVPILGLVTGGLLEPYLLNKASAVCVYLDTAAVLSFGEIGVGSARGFAY